ncbi:MAG: DUF59 domain-containing protein, partial [Gemmatimonadetes bacterium]|nr:DUF59 domain-containing protein [Gemmatimonadota bacterium]
MAGSSSAAICQGSAASRAGKKRRQMAVTEKDVQSVLRGVKDPELGFDVVLLGLVYDIRINGGDVHVTM